MDMQEWLEGLRDTVNAVVRELQNIRSCHQCGSLFLEKDIETHTKFHLLNSRDAMRKPLCGNRAAFVNGVVGYCRAPLGHTGDHFYMRPATGPNDEERWIPVSGEKVREEPKEKAVVTTPDGEQVSMFDEMGPVSDEQFIALLQRATKNTWAQDWPKQRQEDALSLEDLTNIYATAQQTDPWPGEYEGTSMFKSWWERATRGKSEMQEADTDAEQERLRDDDEEREDGEAAHMPSEEGAQRELRVDEQTEDSLTDELARAQRILNQNLGSLAEAMTYAAFRVQVAAALRKHWPTTMKER